MSLDRSEGFPPVLSEQEYVTALEREFLRLRGKAMLLGPADWELACDWYRRQVPLELVLTEMLRLFERQRERGSKRGISSLRYFRAAVEAAWSELQGVRSGGYLAPPAAPLDIARELKRLEQELPDDLPDRERWIAELKTVQDSSRSSIATVEARLGELEERLYDQLFLSLSDSERLAVEDLANRLSSKVGLEIPERERDAVRRTILRQILRQQFSLPRLTLFSSDL